MSKDIPSELRYTDTHEWVKVEDDGLLTIGITVHAQSLLGDMVFIELPEIETELGAGQEAGVVESVKAAADIYSPVTGEVVAVNEELTTNPSLINEDPYGAGWIFKLSSADEAEIDDLLDADAYAEQVMSEEH